MTRDLVLETAWGTPSAHSGVERATARPMPRPRLSPPLHLVRSLRWRWPARRHRSEWTQPETRILVAERAR